MLLWRGYFPRRLPAFLLVYLPVCLLIPWSPSEHVRFIQDPCQERSQSLLLSFMLKGLYSKRESIHVLHHFLGRSRLSPVQGMGSFSIKKVPVWTPLLIWLQQILEKPILSLDLLYRQELWMNEQWVLLKLFKAEEIESYRGYSYRARLRSSLELPAFTPFIPVD